ncbi:MAG: type II toxin-antitoxin system HipA family toxin [Eggerthellaceae bacterium]|nr:type II toxin-antitoxin system HipA family toxin [Eggerthellaceae bacterium]
MADYLQIYIGGMFAGVLKQDSSGALHFSYDRDYSGVPLSLSIPISNRIYDDKKVRPYLLGLLPDSEDVRRSIGREYGVSGNNPFALLRHIGYDCPGAVQICEQGDSEEMLNRGGELVPISKSEIAQRLSRGKRFASAKWETDNERWSLAGQQSKFALRKKDGKWYSCHGSEPTTHIFKPGVPDLQLEALNEYACMQLAERCGINVAHAEYLVFDGEPAIVVERYDRLPSSQGAVVRLHQEDLCQALGVLPSHKYADEGGPGASDIIALLFNTGEPRIDNVKSFLSMLFFNYLIGATDAHAKNYSVLLDKRDAYLAPMYDVASILPYLNRERTVKLAMGIAGENRIGMVSSRRLVRFAEKNKLIDLGISNDDVVGMMADLADRIPKALDGVIAENAHVPGMDELFDHMADPIIKLCERSAARL